VTAIGSRLLDALNAHDVDAFASLLAEDYRSDHPLHPARAFTGRAQARENWSAMFRGVPDLQVEQVATVDEGERLWLELRIHGTRVDGGRLDLRGVIVSEIRDGVIAAARLYVDEVEEAGGDIGQTVARRTGA
jgi:ketosteroid isomerase-like protein